MGGNLTIFDKDHDTVLAAKHTASLQLLCTVGGNQARLDARTECKILELSPKGGVEAGRAHRCSKEEFYNIKALALKGGFYLVA